MDKHNTVWMVGALIFLLGVQECGAVRGGKKHKNKKLIKVSVGIPIQKNGIVEDPKGGAPKVGSEGVVQKVAVRSGFGVPAKVALTGFGVAGVWGAGKVIRNGWSKAPKGVPLDLGNTTTTPTFLSDIQKYENAEKTCLNTEQTYLNRDIVSDNTTTTPTFLSDIQKYEHVEQICLNTEQTCLNRDLVNNGTNQSNEVFNATSSIGGSGALNLAYPYACGLGLSMASGIATGFALSDCTFQQKGLGALGGAIASFSLNAGMQFLGLGSVVSGFLATVLPPAAVYSYKRLVGQQNPRAAPKPEKDIAKGSVGELGLKNANEDPIEDSLNQRPKNAESEGEVPELLQVLKFPERYSEYLKLDPPKALEHEEEGDRSLEYLGENKSNGERLLGGNDEEDSQISTAANTGLNTGKNMGYKNQDFTSVSAERRKEDAMRSGESVAGNQLDSDIYSAQIEQSADDEEVQRLRVEIQELITKYEENYIKIFNAKIKGSFYAHTVQNVDKFKNDKKTVNVWCQKTIQEFKDFIVSSREKLRETGKEKLPEARDFWQSAAESPIFWPMMEARWCMLLSQLSSLRIDHREWALLCAKSLFENEFRDDPDFFRDDPDFLNIALKEIERLSQALKEEEKKEDLLNQERRKKEDEAYQQELEGWLSCIKQVKKLMDKDVCRLINLMKDGGGGWRPYLSEISKILELEYEAKEGCTSLQEYEALKNQVGVMVENEKYSEDNRMMGSQKRGISGLFLSESVQ